MLKIYRKTKGRDTIEERDLGKFCRLYLYLSERACLQRSPRHLSGVARMQILVYTFRATLPSGYARILRLGGVRGGGRHYVLGRREG